LPDQHPGVFRALMAISALNLVGLIWGIVQSDAVVMALSTLNVLVGKSWFNDRMVWLFSERVRTDAEYQNWLY
jgi:hypothetical protein